MQESENPPPRPRGPMKNPPKKRTTAELLAFWLDRSIINALRHGIVCIGKDQLPLSTMAVAMGGNIRVGMEDNIYLGPGEMAPSNAVLVERAVDIVHNLGGSVASPTEAREILDV